MDTTSNNKETKKEKVLLCKGVMFTYSALGQPFFLREDAKDCYGGICTRDWTPSELRKMADYIEANPECKLYSDGSGS